MGFNSAFKGLSSMLQPHRTCFLLHLSNICSRYTNYSYCDGSA